jgi:hypothetical protein
MTSQASTQRSLESAEFWDTHYAAGGTSGTGSYGRLAEFKAEVLNRLLVTYSIDSAIELGCGDGNQLSLINYPSYLGLDTSPTAIDQCRRLFAGDPTKQFRAYRSGDPIPERADLALSLDVVYHLLEDQVYHRYMADLFGAANRLVVVYSSDSDEEAEWPEVRHRRFTTWVGGFAPQWQLRRRIPNRYPYVHGDVDSSWADFFIFEPRRRWWQRGRPVAWPHAATQLRPSTRPAGRVLDRLGGNSKQHPRRSDRPPGGRLPT